MKSVNYFFASITVLFFQSFVVSLSFAASQYESIKKYESTTFVDSTTLTPKGAEVLLEDVYNNNGSNTQEIKIYLSQKFTSLKDENCINNSFKGLKESLNVTEGDIKHMYVKIFTQYAKVSSTEKNPENESYELKQIFMVDLYFKNRTQKNVIVCLMQ